MNTHQHTTFMFSISIVCHWRQCALPPIFLQQNDFILNTTSIKISSIEKKLKYTAYVKVITSFIWSSRFQSCSWTNSCISHQRENLKIHSYLPSALTQGRSPSRAHFCERKQSQRKCFRPKHCHRFKARLDSFSKPKWSANHRGGGGGGVLF